MGRFSKLMPWISQLFPPASAPGVQPSEISDDISLVHEVLTGTEALAELQATSINPAAQVLNAISEVVPAGKFWWVHMAHAFHDDATANRNVRLGILTVGAVNVLVVDGLAGTPNRIEAPRSFVAPPGSSVFAQIDALAAGRSLSLRFLKIEFDIGAHFPLI